MREYISTSFNAEGIRLLMGIFRHRRSKPKGMRWNFENKMLSMSLLKSSPKSNSFLRNQPPFHLDAPCNPYSVLFTLQQASGPCGTGCNESQFGCSGDETHYGSKSKQRCFSR